MTAAVSTPDIATERLPEPERRFLMRSVSWNTYVMLRESLDRDDSKIRLTYLEGALELMSPSGEHEVVTKQLARLLEAYAEERDIPLNGRRSQTFRSEIKQRGLEPDECYTVGPFGDVPEIAIEVIFSSGLVDKLGVYAGLGVHEVWVWKGGALRLHVLASGHYEVRERSEILPGLDIEHLTSFITLDVDADQTRLVRAYRASLRERR